MADRQPDRGRTVVLVAGPSGSGKSHLAARAGLPLLRLDDFYRAGDEPGLPHTLGIVDWDDPASWNCDAAVSALVELCATGAADVPDYRIALNRAVGTHVVNLGDASAVLCEGIFAPELLRPLFRAGVAVRPLWLDRPTLPNFARRLRRDLAEHRKPPLVLVRRGLALARTEPKLRADALRRGFQPVTFDGALADLRRFG